MSCLLLRFGLGLVTILLNCGYCMELDVDAYGDTTWRLIDTSDTNTESQAVDTDETMDSGAESGKKSNKRYWEKGRLINLDLKPNYWNNQFFYNSETFVKRSDGTAIVEAKQHISDLQAIVDDQQRRLDEQDRLIRRLLEQQEYMARQLGMASDLQQEQNATQQIVPNHQTEITLQERLTRIECQLKELMGEGSEGMDMIEDGSQPVRNTFGKIGITVAKLKRKVEQIQSTQGGGVDQARVLEVINPKLAELNVTMNELSRQLKRTTSRSEKTKKVVMQLLDEFDAINAKIESFESKLPK